MYFCPLRQDLLWFIRVEIVTPRFSVICGGYFVFDLFLNDLLYDKIIVIYKHSNWKIGGGQKVVKWIIGRDSRCVKWLFSLLLRSYH